MLNKLYQIASFLWRNTFLKYYRNLKAQRENHYWEEHIRHYGRENPDKTFYVIRRRDAYCGLFSLYITTLVRIDEALKKGFIPIVDMQNSFNLYLDEEKIGKENSWEYYFEQPMNYSLNDIIKSKNIVIGDGSVPKMFPYLDVNFLYGKEGNIEYWRKLAQKYIRVNREIQAYVDEQYDKFFSKKDKVLGIRCRGTDYIREKPKNHPRQPEIEDILREAKRIIKEYQCSKIFLMTEDNSYYQACKNEFGNMLTVFKNKFAVYESGCIGKAMYEQAENKCTLGMDYLVETMLLGKCACLCAGCVSSTVGVLLMANKYEYMYLFDLGIYS